MKAGSNTRSRCMAGVKISESKVSLREGGHEICFFSSRHFIGIEPRQIMDSSKCELR